MSRAAIFAVNANGTSASAPLNRSSRPSTEIARVPRRANSNSGSPRDFARPLSYPATTLNQVVTLSGDACQQAIHRRTERATALVQDRASGQPTLVGDAFSNPDNRPTLQFIAFSERRRLRCLIELSSKSQAVSHRRRFGPCIHGIDVGNGPHIDSDRIRRDKAARRMDARRRLGACRPTVRRVGRAVASNVGHRWVVRKFDRLPREISA